ncbi:MAG: hypothetical protein ACRC3Y_14550 [Romboutsia sp.]|uniref:hypothetical protein n=1 Tax=Romboutsia sp. TaxID=1965302 RepID=UPI003F32F135
MAKHNKLLNVFIAILILITVIVDIVVFNKLPNQMLIKVNMSESIPTLLVMGMILVFQLLFVCISREDNEYTSGIVSFLSQIILFIVNLVLIYINLV